MNREVNTKAIEFLVEYGITKLPIDTEKIALKMGYKIIPPSTALCFRDDLGFEKEALERECWSFTFLGCEYIVLSPSLTPDQRKNYIAHEIGHKIMGHGGDGNIEQQELEADEFMRHIRAPIAVLEKLKVESAQDVAAITGLDSGSSHVVYRDLLAYRERKNEVKKAEKAGGKFRLPIFKIWAKKHKTAIAIALTALILVVGFAVYESLKPAEIRPQNKAEKLAPESQNISETKSQTSTKTAGTQSISSVPDEEDLGNDTPASTVYWTEAGRVYHLYDDCQHIRNSIKVISGSESMATDDGKKDVCKTCLSRLTKTNN